MERLSNLGRSYVFELPFKIIYLIFAFFTYCNLTYAMPIMTPVVDIVLVAGFLCCVTRLFHFKGYMKTPGIVLAVLFVISYIVSMLLNRSYGITENLKGLVWLCFHLFVFFACDTNRDANAYRKEFKAISYVYLSIMMLFSVVSLVQFYTNYSVVEYFSNRSTVIAGLVYGRLWGVFYDPNYASSFAVIAIILSVYYFRIFSRKSLKALMVLNIIVQFFYISYSDSRTGLVALFFAGLIFTYMIFAKFPKLSGFKRQILAIILAAVVGICSVLLPLGIKNVHNLRLEHMIENEEESPNGSDDNEDELIDQIIARPYDMQGDFSNRRIDLWKSGVEVFAKSPVYGTSFFNLKEFAKSVLPDTYLVNNDNGEFNNFHNMLFNLLSAQGILGISIFLIMAVYFVVYVLKRIFKYNGSEYEYLSVLLVVISICLLSSMFLSDVLYVNSPTSVLFWLFLGYIIHFLHQSDIKNQEVKTEVGK